MAALRCSICGFNYPEITIDTCPVCSSELSYMENAEPDEGWQDVIKLMLREHRGETTAIMQLDPPYPPWLFVSHQDLLELGYSALEDFDIVNLNGTKYELQGYLREADCWWIEEVVEADEVDRLKHDLEEWHGQAPAQED